MGRCCARTRPGSNEYSCRAGFRGGLLARHPPGSIADESDIHIDVGRAHERTANFVAELIAGHHINNAAHEYGMAHEAELWREFRTQFDKTDFFPWMYGRPTDGKPNDLGYFIGYRIAKAYYDKALDKRQAVKEIITARNGNVRELLAMSGYDPR